MKKIFPYKNISFFLVSSIRLYFLCSVIMNNLVQKCCIEVLQGIKRSSVNLTALHTFVVNSYFYYAVLKCKIN